MTATFLDDVMQRARTPREPKLSRALWRFAVNLATAITFALLASHVDGWLYGAAVALFIYYGFHVILGCLLMFAFAVRHAQEFPR